MMKRNDQYIYLWLAFVGLLIIAIIIVGGYTRLSGSGLSIVEWKPVVGIIPPLNFNQWELEFAKYKLSPEFNLVNYNLTLAEFKFIYMVEFMHRILARVIAIAIIVPMIYFYKIGYITKKQLPKYIAITILVLLQGLMGWYMVKSGLNQNPNVSHYRLASHLIIAILLYSLIIWQIIPSSNEISQKVRSKLILLLILILLQIFCGGLLAGLKGGLIYNTFPLMGDSFVPEEVYFFSLNDASSVQFLHRSIAYILALLAVYLSFKLYKQNCIKQSFMLLGSCILQTGIGVVTLLLVVPVGWALLHQIGAIIMLSVVIYLIKSAKNT